MSKSIAEVTRLLDGLISKKIAYSQKNDSKHLVQEIDILTDASELMRDLGSIIRTNVNENKELKMGLIKMSANYSALFKVIEVQLGGRLDLKNAQSVEEYTDLLDRLITSSIKDSSELLNLIDNLTETHGAQG